MTKVSCRVAVVGSGYMGKGIAHTLARGGAQVTLVDQDPESAERAHRAMLDDVAHAGEIGLLERGALEQVRAGTGWSHDLASGVSSADLIVEAVFEDLAVKHVVLAQIEEAARDDAVIVTNTSALPVKLLASALKRPERFFGMHWFNPAPYLPGVEVILAEQSDETLLPLVMELLSRAGKEPVVVADRPGFVANRLQFALFKEATLMVEEGAATPEQIDDVVCSTFGFRLPFFGPFAVADMAGLDVYAAGMRTLAETVGERFSVPAALAEKVAAGELGTKTGAGFLSLTPAEAAAMIERRDRLYVALSRLREDESHQNPMPEWKVSAMSEANLSSLPARAAAHQSGGNVVQHPSAEYLTADAFKAAFRNHPAGVAVITADAGAGPVALTATSVFSVSAEPPLFVFSISEASSSAPTIRQADTVVVHLLGAGQLDIAKLGATSGIDRFADTSIWTRLPTGEPYFPATHAWIRGRIVNKMEAGKSTVVAVLALESNSPAAGDPSADAAEAQPLVYHNRTWHRLSEDSKVQ